jgi:p-cumate 2,3-dioxygenase alpha subunit
MDTEQLQSAVIDDPEEGVFRVKRKTMTSEAVWRAERSRIFDRVWLYIAHDSEIPAPGDYVRRTVSTRPLLLVRGRDGIVRALLNACTHRGARVCRQDQGNASSFQCFYHAWTFNTEGKLVGVPDRGAYADAIRLEELALRPVPRLECYRDFWFVSFKSDIEPLVDYLAGAKEYIDLVADQGRDGMVVVPGTHKYACNANWKLMVENSVDGYHGVTLHHTYFAYLATHDSSNAEALRAGNARAYDLGNGHAVLEFPAPYPRPIARWGPMFGEDAKEEVRAIREELEERCGAARAYRMADTCRNLLIYPNMFLLDVPGLTIRTVWPLGPAYMELNGYALAARGESPDQLRRRLESFNLFLGPGGFASPDDVEALEACQEGFAADANAYSDISRGMHRDATVIDELQMRSFWREWQANMLGTAHGIHGEGRRTTSVEAGP